MPSVSELQEMLKPDHLIGALVYLAVVLCVAALLSKILRTVVHGALSRHHEHIDRTSANFLRQLVTALIWVFALIFYSRLIPPLRALGTTLLAGASIASVVIGLAAQSTLGNLVAGIAMLIYRPFRVGDTVQVAAPSGPETGVVDSISLGYTILRTSDGRTVVLPNAVAASQVTINLTASSVRGVVNVSIRLARHSDVHRAIDVAAQVAAQECGKENVIGCYLSKMEAGVPLLELRVRTPEDRTPERLRSALIERLAEKFEAEHLVPEDSGLSFA